MTLFYPAPEPNPPPPSPSLDRSRPNPQGWGGDTGGQSRSGGTAARSASASVQRRNLIAIATDRLTVLEAAGEWSTKGADGKWNGSPTHALWRTLYDGWNRCGWSALYRNELSGTVLGLPCHCDKPLCPYDEQRRVGELRDRYRAAHDAALADGRLFFVDLTVPNTFRGTLAESFDVIRGAITRLRRRKWWADAVLGGLWRLEVTVNLTTGTWHPHANLLFEVASPIEMREWQPLLLREWRLAVLAEVAARGVQLWPEGARDDCWIWLYAGWDRPRERGRMPSALAETIKRQVRQARDVDAGQADAKHDGDTTLDYTVKAPRPDWINAADARWVIEYVESQAGRRQVSSFGSWRGLPPAPPPPERDEPTVDAPWVPGDDPHVTRRLPMYDPTLPLEGQSPAEWQPYGHGPRWTLRLVRPSDEGRGPWLVWRPGDDPPDPSTAEDDTAFSYTLRADLSPPGRPA